MQKETAFRVWEEILQYEGLCKDSEGSRNVSHGLVPAVGMHLLSLPSPALTTAPSTAPPP